MQQTQFDRGQVLKGSFSELNSGLRTVGTNAILKDAYTHFTQTVNGSGYPIRVVYYQALDPALDELTFVGDTAKSLAGKYFLLEEFLTKTVHAFYYVVDGTGTAPGVADAETAIAISENDNAATVAFATKTTLDGIEDFIVKSQSFLTNSITIEYYQFGETPAIDLATSGFSTTRLKEGQSIKVGEVDLSYSGSDPVYNGSTLKGLLYNPYTASFELSSVSGSVSIADGDGDELDINPDGSVNAIIKKNYDNFTITARDSFNNITQVEYYLGAVLVKTVDLVYDAEGCLVSYTES